MVCGIWLGNSSQKDTHMAIKLKKRGRPSKADVAARQGVQRQARRTDGEVLKDLKERFQILSLLTQGSVHSNIRAVTVTGAPGVGKTYSVEQVLERSGTKYEIVRGAISALNLYMLAYKYRQPGNVVVLDDADDIFNDLDAVNILKVLCDTGSVRRVSYLKEAHQLKENDVPQSFEFNGAFIFISNVDFAKFVEDGKNKFAPHMGALMSRSLYLDLQIHDRNALGVWVNHMATAARIFDIDGVPQALRPEILGFLTEHRDTLYEISLRTLKKLNQLAKTNPEQWRMMARVLLCKM